jgi:hypothetical protein
MLLLSFDNDELDNLIEKTKSYLNTQLSDAKNLLIDLYNIRNKACEARTWRWSEILNISEATKA